MHVIQIMQDNNEGMQLLDDYEYFTIVDYLNAMIYDINGVDGSIIDVQEPSPPSLIPLHRQKPSSNESNKEEEKVPQADNVNKKAKNHF